MSLSSHDLERATALTAALRSELRKAMIGQQPAVEEVITALLARGHVLIEGVPGLGKTLLARALARAMSLGFSRVQFTPDLMPADVVGHVMLERTEGSLAPSLRVHRGPVFTNLLLADEINRAPAKTQSALLEVMQEAQVTLEGQSLALPQPFMVLATQNPVDTEGTYPLPEAQLDRFLLKVEIGYPGVEEEAAIVRGSTEHRAGDQLPLEAVAPCMGEADVLQLQAWTAAVRVEDAVVDYAVRLVRATRDWPGLSAGAGPRGAIALVRAARAGALLAGRDFVVPDDVKQNVLPALRHRVMPAPDAQLEGREVQDLLADIAGSTEAPRA